MPWTTGEIVGAVIGGIFVICIIIVIVLACLGYFKSSPPIVHRSPPPDEPERERATGFGSSYELATGTYWVGNAVNTYLCPGAPGSGGLNGYCAFGGTSARQNAETQCNKDTQCVGYANATVNGQAHYVLSNAPPVKNMQHPPNLYYVKPGIEAPKLSVADSSNVFAEPA